MQRVGAAGDRFFDDPVVAELGGGDGQPAEQAAHPEPADRLAGVGGLVGDQQIWAGSGGPPVVAEGEVAADRGGGEYIEEAVEAAEVEPAAGQVDLDQPEMTDLAGQQCVDPGQRDRCPQGEIVLGRLSGRGEQVRGRVRLAVGRGAAGASRRWLRSRPSWVSEYVLPQNGQRPRGRT